MDWDAFRDWNLADRGRARATVYYNIGRARTLVRAWGLDVEALLSSPAGADAQARSVVAKLKLAHKSGHVVRKMQQVLNWLFAYARFLQPALIWPADLELEPEPPSIPKSVDVDAMDRIWAYEGSDPYTTRLRRAIAFIAYHGNFRRSEAAQLRIDLLRPRTGQIGLPRAAKGSLSGDVEVPWTAFWPESPLIQYLEVRVNVPGSLALWTIPPGRGSRKPRVLQASGLYRHLKTMGDDLGIPLNFVRMKRRQLSDLDDVETSLRVVQHKGRHVKAQNTERYLSRVSGSRARRELAARGVPGYEPEAADRVADIPGTKREVP